MSLANRRFIGLLVSAYLLLQIAVPAVLLFAPPPARYGWQLFDAVPDAAYVLIDEVGPSTIDARDFVFASRTDLDATPYLPAHLCSVVPETREVRVRKPADTVAVVIPCEVP